MEYLKMPCQPRIILLILGFFFSASTYSLNSNNNSFADSLKNCSQGSFIDPKMVQSMKLSYKIEGIDGEFCLITITIDTPNSDTTQIISTCKINNSKLPLLAQFVNEGTFGEKLLNQQMSDVFSVNMCSPQKEINSRKNYFKEVIQATAPLKLGVEQCYQALGAGKSVIGCAGGTHGVPENITVGHGNIGSLTTTDSGVITATGSALNGLSTESYILTPTPMNNVIIWSVSGTCIKDGLC